MTQPPPQTGDPVVDEVISTFRETDGQPLAERAEAALEAQRGLQARLTDSPPGTAPGSGPAQPRQNLQEQASAEAMARVAGTGARARPA